MLFIKVFADLPQHNKLKKAARLLGIDPTTMIGHMVRMWLWTVGREQGGDFTGLDAGDISDACEWHGDPDRFLSALLGCGRADGVGFLERTETGTILVHGWPEVMARLLEVRELTRRRVKNFRDRHASEAVTTDVTRYSNACNALVTPMKRAVTRTDLDLDLESKTKSKSMSRTAFAPPTTEDLREYGAKIGMSVLEQDKFFDHFTARSWKTTSGKMGDWKAAQRNWHRNEGQFSPGKNGNKAPVLSFGDPDMAGTPEEEIV